MILKEMHKKTLALIEEIVENPEDPTLTTLTNDPDIESKLNYVINQIQYELSRIKKIPAYKELKVNKGDLIYFKDIDNINEVYQIDIVKGVKHEYKANGTIIKVLEDGVAEIEYYKYPVRIDENTQNTYEFELSSDVLECMAYGVASDVLKSDVSNAYGNIYAERYEKMKQQLDSRYNMGMIEIGAGI